jgi:hypothetical protein
LGIVSKAPVEYYAGLLADEVRSGTAFREKVGEDGNPIVDENGISTEEPFY